MRSYGPWARVALACMRGICMCRQTQQGAPTYYRTAARSCIGTMCDCNKLRRMLKGAHLYPTIQRLVHTDRRVGGGGYRKMAGPAKMGEMQAGLNAAGSTALRGARSS